MIRCFAVHVCLWAKCTGVPEGVKFWGGQLREKTVVINHRGVGRCKILGRQVDGEKYATSFFFFYYFLPKG